MSSRNRLPSCAVVALTSTAIALLVLGVAVAESGGASRSFTIRTSDGYVTRIGTFKVRGTNQGTLAQAIAAFGRPSEVDPSGDGSDACYVTWRRLRIRATFANFGLADACSPSGGLLQSATLRSRRFRTTRGVRVGTRSRTIPAKHHNAQFRNGSWWIASAVLPFGDQRETPTVRALVRNGQVSAFTLFIGAAGD